MDEPISHIDARLRSKVRAELKHLLRDLNATTIYVTHNQAEALSMADRIAVMSDGELQQMGTAEAIYEHPANLFVADFVGEPPMNLMPCKAVRDNGHLMLRVAPMAIAPSRQLGDLIERRQDQGELVLGVRPVDVELSWSPSAEAVGTGTVSLVENLGDEQIVAVRVGDHSLESVVDASVHGQSRRSGLAADAARTGACLRLWDWAVTRGVTRPLLEETKEREWRR